MKKLQRSGKQRVKRRLAYGTLSVILTVLIIAVTVIANAAVSALSEGFGWYVDMSDSLIYGIGDSCEEYLEDIIFPAMDKQDKKERIKIILCDERSELVSNTAQKYIFETVSELCEKYPERITLEYLNIWESPTEARGYGVSSPSDVVFKYKDRHSTLTAAQFYVTSNGDTENPTAYNAEQRISSALLRIVRDSSPVCYFTVNHGESLDDPELMYLIADAGFNYSFLDMSRDGIPADCELLITAAPANDLIGSDGGSDVNETHLLDTYMSNGGRYIVFLGADTLSAGRLSGFESFLGDWGVSFLCKTDPDGTKNYCALRDSASSVSADSMTFLGQTSDTPLSSDMLGEMNKKPYFGNAAAITPADGYIQTDSGSYINGSRTISPLLCSASSAEAWAGGRLTHKADETPFTLMSLSSEPQNNAKTAYLLACSSVDFCKEESMQSTVYGNKEILLRAVSYMGYSGIPLNISSRPLTTPPIQSLTRRSATLISIVLCTLPPLSVAIVGTVVIIRRRRA